MAHTYTPGLRVTERCVIRKRRILPIRGEVLVRQGDRVGAEQVVARTEIPGKVHTVNVVNLLSIAPEEIRQFMRKKEGDGFEQGEVIAENRPLIRWFKTQVRAPVKGKIDTISEVTGQVLLREPPRPLEMQAFLEGTVVEVVPQEGCVVEAEGAFIQGIFGIGGEAHGEIVMAVDGPDRELTPDRIEPGHRGKIVVGGAHVPAATLARVREVGAAGIVVGAFHDKDLKDVLGYDLGVAITGTEQVGFTLILTEGFGTIAMAKRTFDLLASKAGKKAAISGATQIRAGVLRPEIIVPLASAGPPAARPSEKEREGLKPGDLIRVIRAPHFGRLAKVKSLPSDLRRIDTESRVRVLEAEFGDGTIAVIPRANVELIEA
jgi:hypothetical protein